MREISKYQFDAQGREVATVIVFAHFLMILYMFYLLHFGWQFRGYNKRNAVRLNLTYV